MERRADDNDFSNIEVEDGENFYSQKSLSKEQIILKALQRCMDEGSKEMTEGGVLSRIVGGQEYQIAVPNQKEIFINSIKIFWSLMFPIVIDKYKTLCEEQIGNFSDKYNKILQEYEEARNSLRNNHHYKDSPSALRDARQEVKSRFEQKKMDLYREKLDFGIMVLDKENWFGERFA